MLLGSSLNPINSSLIATALVPIATAMHVSVGRTAILVSGLYLASSSAQPTAGKLSEEFGPRRIFLAGILLVLAGGLVGGLAQDLTTLIIARVLIGVGTSAGYPSAMLMIRRRAAQAGLDAPPGSVLGALVIAGMVTPAVGLPLGGVLVQGLSWRASFLVNVSLALVALAMAVVWIPRDPRSGTVRTARELATRIDLGGIAGFGGTMVALLVFLMSLPRPNWIALAVAAVLGAALIWWELRADRPFFDLRLLARNLEQIGTASGLFRTFGYIGSIASSAIIAITFHAGVSDHGLHLIAVTMIAVSAVALLLTVADRHLMRQAKTGPDNEASPASPPASLPAEQPAGERNS